MLTLASIFFRDKEGHIWEGQEGAQFGELMRVSDTSTVAHGEGDDVENGPRREDGYAPLPGDAGGAPYPRSSSGSPYRMLFPFFSHHHRRAATGLAAHRLSRFDTCQILKMSRG